MPPKRTIRVFIASPGDLAVERAAFKQVLDELNCGFGDGAGVTFEPLGWEDTLASTGRRSQEVINQDIDRCDVFLLAMHRRWGQAAPDAKPYSSYTEEEFHRAFDRWKQKPKGKKPQAPEIFVFFKHIDPGQMADAGPQLQKVLDFRRQLEESRQVLYHGFANEAEFKAEVDRHLRAFAKGELPKANAARNKALLPLAVLVELQKEKAEKEQAIQMAEQAHQDKEAANARAERLALILAEQAAGALGLGNAEECRQKIAKAMDGTNDIQVMSIAFDVYFELKDFDEAESILQRWLAVSGIKNQNALTSVAIHNMGRLYQGKNQESIAEKHYIEALKIDEQIGRLEGVANNSFRLGMMYRTRRGGLEPAKEMIEKSLHNNRAVGNTAGIIRDTKQLAQINKLIDRLNRETHESLDQNELQENLEQMQGLQ